MSKPTPPGMPDDAPSGCGRHGGETSRQTIATRINYKILKRGKWFVRSFISQRLGSFGALLLGQ